MKKFVSILLSLLITFGFTQSALLATTKESISDPDINAEGVRLSVEPYTESITSVAIQHLSDIKSVLFEDYETLGFSNEEISEMEIGHPFSIYIENDDDIICSSDVIVFPLLFSNKVIGVLEILHEPSSGIIAFSFGKSYGETINELCNEHRHSESADFAVININNLLIATDGLEITVLSGNAEESERPSTVSDIKSAYSNLLHSTELDYSNISIPIYVDNTDKPSIHKTIQPPQVLAYPNPLPVPHVSQGGGVCGVAAWAAVLNYRFGKSYTTPSLDSAMRAGGYYNGSNKPTMTDYRNFANDKYNAGATYNSSPMSINSTKNAILAGKPIMGSWKSSSSTHAIIISGYKQTSSTLVYYLKNPWHNYTQIITVTSPNLVYPDSGYTWRLVSSVH